MIINGNDSFLTARFPSDAEKVYMRHPGNDFNGFSKAFRLSISIHEPSPILDSERSTH